MNCQSVQTKCDNFYFWSWSNGTNIEKSPIKIFYNGCGQFSNVIPEISFSEKNTHKDNIKDKRLGQNEKLSQRELVIQTSSNPFMDNNYIQHLSDQDTFLKPQDSNFSK